MIIILVILLSVSNSQNLINIGEYCNCEELTNEFDCNYLIRCKFQNGKCSTLTCPLLGVDNCMTSQECAVYNNSCVVFTQCQDYMASNTQNCWNLNHNCYYETSQNNCNQMQTPQVDCEYLDKENCHYGKDGKCIYKSDQCKRWLNCEDADYNQCSYGALHCAWSDTKEQCVSVNQCDQIVDDLCVFAFPFMNSNQGYICSFQDNKCYQFDALQQNNTSCIVNSYGYYHWKDNQCQQCNQENYSLITQTLFLLFITIII